MCAGAMSCLGVIIVQHTSSFADSYLLSLISLFHSDPSDASFYSVREPSPIGHHVFRVEWEVVSTLIGGCLLSDPGTLS